MCVCERERENGVIVVPDETLILCGGVGSGVDGGGVLLLLLLLVVV